MDIKLRNVYLYVNDVTKFAKNVNIRETKPCKSPVGIPSWQIPYGLSIKMKF